MTAWLLFVLLETGAAIPLDIFPDNEVGQDSCLAVIETARDAIKQAVVVKCGRFTITPLGTFEPA